MLDKLQEDLFEAIWACDLESCKIAFEKGADIHSKRNTSGDLPLVAAVCAEDPDIARWLIEQGADVGREDLCDEWSPLFYAHNAVLCELLLDHGANIHVRDKDGATPLLYIAARGTLEACKVLVTRGADVQAVTSQGYSVLHGAMWSGGSIYGERVDLAERCRYFMQFGLRSDSRPADPQKGYLTPFQYAVKHGYADVVALFCDECNENPDQKTLAGRTMWQLANYHWPVKSLLEQRRIEYGTKSGIDGSEVGMVESSPRRSSGPSPL